MLGIYEPTALDVPICSDSGCERYPPIAVDIGCREGVPSHGNDASECRLSWTVWGSSAEDFRFGVQR